SMRLQFEPCPGALAASFARLVVVARVLRQRKLASACAANLWRPGFVARSAPLVGARRHGGLLDLPSCPARRLFRGTAGWPDGLGARSSDARNDAFADAGANPARYRCGVYLRRVPLPPCRGSSVPFAGAVDGGRLALRSVSTSREMGR